jgi:cell division initiation protein
MKITPLEIRQKSFEKVFRGYDKDEVNAFLITLSHEWEKILDDSKELRQKLDNAEKEISKLREVETSLYKTLKTAEDTGATMIQQASKASELQLKETQLKAERMIQEARRTSSSILQKSEHQSRELLERLLEEVKRLEQAYKMMQGLKENMLSDLRNMANEMLERTRKFGEGSGDQEFTRYLKRAREYAEEFEFSVPEPEAETVASPEKKPEELSEQPAPEEPLVQERSGQKSFFDQIQ